MAIKRKPNENVVQPRIKKEIERRFPGCIIMKTDSGQIQGIPDLLVLYNDHWALLECKKSSNAAKRSNQEYYVDKCNKMSFSAFVNPNNMEDVLDEMEQSFKV